MGRDFTIGMTFISDVQLHEALLVDDHLEYVHPGQESQWIHIKQFAQSYSDDDSELKETIKKVELKIKELSKLY